MPLPLYACCCSPSVAAPGCGADDTQADADHVRKRSRSAWMLCRSLVHFCLFVCRMRYAGGCSSNATSSLFSIEQQALYSGKLLGLLRGGLSGGKGLGDSCRLAVHALCQDQEKQTGLSLGNGVLRQSSPPLLCFVLLFWVTTAYYLFLWSVVGWGQGQGVLHQVSARLEAGLCRSQDTRW